MADVRHARSSSVLSHEPKPFSTKASPPGFTIQIEDAADNGLMFVPFNGQHTPAKHAAVQRSIRQHVMQKFIEERNEDHQGTTKRLRARESGGTPQTFKLRESGRWEERRTKRPRFLASPSVPSSAPEAQRQNDKAWRLAPGYKLSVDDEGTGRDRSVKERNPADQALPTAPLLAFGRSRLDPFGIIPFDLTRREEMLIDRFHSYIAQSWCPVSAQGPWFGFALQDELLFHATMFHWSCKFVDTRRDLSDLHPEAIGHKVLAIRMIKQRLQGPKPTVTDQTIAAIAALVNAGVGLGNLQEVQRHMEGLETVLGLVGGALHLSSAIGGVLLKLMKWNKLIYQRLLVESTTMGGCVDGFNVLDPMAGYHSPDGPSVDIWEVGQVERSLENDVVCTFRSTSQIFRLSQKRPSAMIGEDERSRRSLELSRLEGRLQGHVFMLDFDNGLDSILGAALTVGLAYLLHTAFNLGNWSTAEGLRQSPIVKSIWRRGHSPLLLIRSLTIASIIPFGQLQHNCFIENLAHACRAYNVLEWSHYRAMLQNFFWFEYLSAPCYERTWSEIQRVLQRLGQLQDKPYPGDWANVFAYPSPAGLVHC